MIPLLLMSMQISLAIEPTTVHHRGASFLVVPIAPGEADVQVVGQGTPGVQSEAELEEWLTRTDASLLGATNAGMFEADHTPVGLFVERGQVLHPLNRRRGSGNFYLEPNGVFWTDAAGAPVTETSTFAQIQPPGVFSATQSGPLLVTGGRIHPAFQPDSPNRLVRSAVGVDPQGTVYLVISDGPTTFHQLASLFTEALDCPDALYLDGVVSTLIAPQSRFGHAASRWAGFIVATEAADPDGVCVP